MAQLYYPIQGRLLCSSMKLTETAHGQRYLVQLVERSGGRSEFVSAPLRGRFPLNFGLHAIANNDATKLRIASGSQLGQQQSSQVLLTVMNLAKYFGA
jgi:hypothetical protein